MKKSSTNQLNRKFLIDCNLTYAVQLIGGRWKLPILMRLHKGKNRFSELKKTIPNITERMLTLQLKELETDGLIARTVLAGVPKHVEYSLTSLGNELVPVCFILNDWGASHKLSHLGEQSNLAE